MVDQSLRQLEKAEARFLKAHGWRPVPKSHPKAPQWWAIDNPACGDQDEFEQGRAVQFQKARMVR
jgi:hypothetical protein